MEGDQTRKTGSTVELDPATGGSTAETTSWDEFMKTGCAQGDYLYVLKSATGYINQTLAPTTAAGITSDTFDIAFPWKLVVHPTGDSAGQQQPDPCMSVYLQLENCKTLPPTDQLEVSFTLSVVNRVQPAASVLKRGGTARFTAEQGTWGIQKLIALTQLKRDEKELMPDGNLHIGIKLEVKREEKHQEVTWPHTGYIGLKKQTHSNADDREHDVALRNQGAAGYMHTLLQTLHSVPQFRTAAHVMPVVDGDAPDAAIPRTLKRVFGKLEYSQTPVSKKRPLGWVTGDAFVPERVEALVGQLCDKLEEKARSMCADAKSSHPHKASRLNIPVDVLEEDDSFHVAADVPGVRKDAINLDIDAHSRTLTISVSHPDDPTNTTSQPAAPAQAASAAPTQAARTARGAAGHVKVEPGTTGVTSAAAPQALLRERLQRFGARTLKFPETADLAGAKAEFVGGVLRVSIPKKPPPKPVRLAIA